MFQWLKKRFICPVPGCGAVISEVWLWQRHRGMSPCPKHRILESVSSRGQLIGTLQDRLAGRLAAMREVERLDTEIACLRSAIVELPPGLLRGLTLAEAAIAYPEQFVAVAQQYADRLKEAVALLEEWYPLHSSCVSELGDRTRRFLTRLDQDKEIPK